MNPVPGVLHEAFGWCLRTSLEAVVVVGAILAVQAVLRRRMPPGWAYWLWLILLARLVLPWTPESALSVFNLLPQPAARVEVAAPAAGVAPPEALPASPVPAPMVLTPPAPSPDPVISLTGRDLLALAWLVGVVVALAWPVANAVRFRRKALASTVIHHAGLGELLEDCKRLMGVTAPVEMRACEAVTSPAILGFLRPRLLLPPMLGARLSREELRFIFLHELAHLKRCDILVNWLLALVQAVHWFNPAVWYAFWRMRSDRELACDALALSRLRAEESSAYGHTLLRLFEHVQAPQHVPSVAGISEGRSQLTRRIVMIARFKGRSPWGIALGMVVAAVGAVCLLTAAIPEPVEGAPSQAPVVPEVETHEDAEGRWVDRIDYPFVDDPAVLGFWESVDFVQEPKQFSPGTQQFGGDLYLKDLNFFPNGATNGPWHWTYGLVMHPGDNTASRYYIENIDGQDYLFFEWKSGDYSIRHSAPQYYVLKRTAEAPIVAAPRVPAAPDFELDPEAVGHWESVDFVAQPRQFNPAKRHYQGDLYLKRLVLLDDGRTNGSWVWSRGLLVDSATQAKSRYRLREVGREKYMFLQSEGSDPAGHYVLKRATWPDAPEKAVFIPPTTATDEGGNLVDRIDYAFVDDPAVLGPWKSVDFVAEPDYFLPGRQQWTGDLHLKGIDFRPGGKTGGMSLWTNGLLLHPENRTASRYIIRNLEGQDYLFMEWKSGDYTIRRTKPQYYVLKRVSEEDGATAPAASQPSAPSTGELAERVASFPLGSATGEEARRHFGEPQRFVIGPKTLDPAQLPSTYCMVYPDGFRIFVVDGKAGELRFEGEGDYKFEGRLGIGSSVEEALSVLGAPVETVVGQAIGWRANVLYKDIEGRTGDCYYDARPDKGVRLFFRDSKVCALYFPAPWFN